MRRDRGDGGDGGDRGDGVVVARAHVDGRVDDALVGYLERALDLAVDEVADGARAGRRQPLLRQVTTQRQLRRGYLIYGIYLLII